MILARERLDRERRKKAENRQARAEAEFSGQNDGTAPASFVALAPNSVLHETDPASRASPMSSTAMLTPPESGESPVVGSRDGAGFGTINGHPSSFTGGNLHPTQAGQPSQGIVEGIWNRLAGEAHAPRDTTAPWPPPHAIDSKTGVQQQITSADQAAYDREISVEIAKLVASFRPDGAAPERIPVPNNSIPYRGLDYDTLRALRSYIYEEESTIPYEEEALLNCLEKAWREGMRADHDRIVENIPVFIARERAFLTWIELKRHLAALERADKRMSARLYVYKANILTTCRLAKRGPLYG